MTIETTTLTPPPPLTSSSSSPSELSIDTNEDRLRKRQSLWQQGRRHHHQREGISNVEEEDYKVGDDIWIPKDDDGMFEMAKIVSIPKPFNGDIKIRTKSTTTSTSSSIGRERIVNISEIYESNGGNIEVDTIKDVSQMAIVNEPIVNDIIKRRYLNDIIYTSARPMLILVNPFRDLNNTTSPIASYYRDMVPDEGQIEQSPPHIFRIAAQALTAYYVNGGIISRDDINDDGMFSGRGSSSVYDDQSLTGLNDNVVVDDDGGKGGGNVSILISGESGAGKTETCKHLIKFFTESNIDATPKLNNNNNTTTSTSSSSLNDALMAFNPILEAFGNAKTSRNDNSSRFGKLVKLYLSTPPLPSTAAAAAGVNNGSSSSILLHNPVVAGGEVSSFLLEKSRICLHENGERNYHIFYQLLRGGSPELLGIDGLDLNPHTETYKVLNNTLSTITGVDDAMEYQNTMNAMIALGIDNRQRFDICRVLGGILHGGEIEWIDSKDEDRIGYNKNNNGGGGNISDINKDNNNHPILPCMPSEESRFILLSKLFGLPPDHLLKAITVQTRRLPGNNVVLSPVSPQQCSDNVASISRYCYSIIFQWIIRKINTSLSPMKDNNNTSPLRWIGVLDIFGFESFEHRNSLEQFLVNVANERLQLCFTQRVFELEKKVYLAEGLSGDTLASEVVEYAPVEPLLKVLQGPSYGCISHIESACLLQTGTDDSIMNAMLRAGYPNNLFTDGMTYQQQQQSNNMNTTITTTTTASSLNKGNRLLLRQNPNDIFIIHHTAGSVTYNIKGFRDKNMDRLSDDLYNLISSTRNGVLREAAAAASSSVVGYSTSDISIPAIPGDNNNINNNTRRSYIAQKFVHSMDSLMATLEPTEAFFVRCVKPNTYKKARLYNSRYVMRQLHSLSVFHAIKMSNCGYCFRLPFRQFLDRYQPITFLNNTKSTEDIVVPTITITTTTTDNVSLQEECVHFLKTFIAWSSHKQGVIVGKSMILATKEVHIELEKARNWILSDIMDPIAYNIRRSLSEKHAIDNYNMRANKLVTIQSMLRSYLIRRTEMQRTQYRRGLITVALLERKVYMFLSARGAAMQLQTASRNLLGMLSYERRRKNLEIMNASSVLQCYGRSIISRVKFECRKESKIRDIAARHIQGAMRKAYTRRSYGKNWIWRMLVWPMRRHYLMRNDAALLIQSVWKSYTTRRSNPEVIKRIHNARDRAIKMIKIKEARILLDSVIEAYLARNTMIKYNNAAIIIQARIRGILRPRKIKIREVAATKIQSLWRGYVIRVIIAISKARVIQSALKYNKNTIINNKMNYNMWLTLLYKQYYTTSFYRGLSLLQPPEEVHIKGEISTGNNNNNNALLPHTLIRGFMDVWQYNGPLLDIDQFKDGSAFIGIQDIQRSLCLVLWGIGFTHNLYHNSNHKPTIIPLPTIKHSLNQAIAVDSISCGIEHTLILVQYAGSKSSNSINAILAFGSNTHGQCGLSKDNILITTPQQILLPEGSGVGHHITSISAGPYHSLCNIILNEDDDDGSGGGGRIYAWGSMNGISLPTQFTKDTFIPKPIFTTLRFNKVYATCNGNLGITHDGCLAAWGIHNTPRRSRYNIDKIFSTNISGGGGPKVILSSNNNIGEIHTLSYDVGCNRFIIVTKNGIAYYWGTISNVYTTCVGIPHYDNDDAIKMIQSHKYDICEPLRIDIPKDSSPIAQAYLSSDMRVVIRLMDGNVFGWDYVTIAHYNNTKATTKSQPSTIVLRPGLFQYRYARKANKIKVMYDGTVLGEITNDAARTHLPTITTSLRYIMEDINKTTHIGNITPKMMMLHETSNRSSPMIQPRPPPETWSDIIIRSSINIRVPNGDSRSKPSTYRRRRTTPSIKYPLPSRSSYNNKEERTTSKRESLNTRRTPPSPSLPTTTTTRYHALS